MDNSHSDKAALQIEKSKSAYNSKESMVELNAGIIESNLAIVKSNEAIKTASVESAAMVISAINALDIKGLIAAVDKVAARLGELIPKTEPKETDVTPPVA
jgi:hypothetical protein